VVGRISRLSGLKEQEAELGSPEQETVINIGDVSAEGFTGVIITFAVPAAPALSTTGKEAGVTGVSDN
jgi:hypothetical protein